MWTVVSIFVCFFICSNALVFPSWGDQSRIAGGSLASISEFPYAAALLTNQGSGTVYTHRCGGTILTTSAILSAASCFNSQGINHAVQWWRARVGSVHSNAGGTVHAIRLITSHPGYDWIAGDHDLAILRATIPITYVPNVVAPASIAGSAYTLTTNEVVSAIGWGQTSENGALSTELRSVQFWIVNHQTCQNRYRGLGFDVTDNMVCAGWLDVGVRGQCQGDAGSALLHNSVVVGVYSWTQGCAEGWFPDINMWVPAYTAWIVATANA